MIRDASLQSMYAQDTLAVTSWTSSLPDFYKEEDIRTPQMTQNLLKGRGIATSRHRTDDFGDTTGA